MKLGEHPDGIYRLTTKVGPGGQPLQYLTPVRYSIKQRRYVPDKRRIALLRRMQEVDAQAGKDREA